MSGLKPRTLGAIRREHPGRHAFVLSTAAPERGGLQWSIDGPLSEDQCNRLMRFALALIAEDEPRQPEPATAAPAIPARINPTDVRERFQSYIMGWRDRAVGRARRRENLAHRPDLLAEYDRGEADGAVAAAAAASAAAARLGYDLELAIIDR